MPILPKLKSAIAIIVSVLVCNSCSGQFYSLESSFGLADAISNDGRVTGSFLNSANQYFLWEAGGSAMNIGGVSAGGGVGGSPDISDDGNFIGGVTFNNASGFHEFSRYDVETGTWTALGGLGGSSGTEISSGWGISGDGQSVVGLAWINAGQTHAVQWTSGVGVIDLGSTISGESARANGVNFDGSVVAGWQDGAGRQGAVWVDGTQTLIFTDDDGPSLEASAVSADGNFVVGFGIAESFNGVGNAYRYNVAAKTYMQLPNLPAAGQRNMAGASVSQNGSIVVGGTWPFGVPASFGNGFIWEERLGTMTPREYFEMNGIKDIPANFNFNFVADVSADGTWFTGWGGTGAIANQTWAVRVNTVLPGDVNMDGVVDLLDVAPFVDLLANMQFQAVADINQDGVVDLLDVNPFVELLTGN